jgi:hypothetical protein
MHMFSDFFNFIYISKNINFIYYDMMHTEVDLFLNYYFASDVYLGPPHTQLEKEAV